MAGVGDGLGLDPLVQLANVPQIDVIEGDDDGVVEAVRFLEYLDDLPRQQLGPVVVLQLHFETDIIGDGPLDGFAEGGDGDGAGVAGEFRRGIELEDILEIPGVEEAVAVGRAVERRVVEDDDLVVAGEADVDLATGGAGLHRLLEGEQRIFGIVAAIAAMGADAVNPCRRNGKRTASKGSAPEFAHAGRQFLVAHDDAAR